MTCGMVRRRLGAVLEPDREVREHLAGCAACARFRERLDLARVALAEHGPAVEPDAGFAARVSSRLGRPSDVLTWAALRLLPATLSLALALGIASQYSPATELADTGADIEAASGDDLLLWIADASEVEPR